MGEFRSVLPAIAFVGGVAASLLGAVSNAQAQAVTELGTFNDWSAFSIMESGKKVCYVASKPKKDEGNYKQRGDIYMLVTHRPAQKQYYVVTVYAGYTYKPGSPVTVAVDKNQFQLFTEGETAWAHDDMDKKLVDALRRGNSMVVTGTSSRGTVTRDTYSLKGISASIQKINETCGVK